MPHRKLKDVVEGQELVCVAPSGTVSDAVKAMQRHRYSCLPVLENGELVGVFTSTNFVKGVIDPGLDPATTSIVEVMTRDPKCIDAERQGIEAIQVMKDEGIRHVIVTGCEGCGFAVVTLDDFPNSEINEIEEELKFEQRLWEEL